MGTRADFYVGRGEQAEWLGSTAWDGYPRGVFPDYPELFTSPTLTEPEYRGWVAGHLEGRNDGTKPEQGWPWPWDDSRTTDYAYAYEDGKIYGSCFGYPWFQVDPNASEWGEPQEDEEAEYVPLPKEEKVIFPNMLKLKATTYGARSGLMVISIPTTDNI